jgi:DNA-directed RNA polymerase specialized sigma24 family protein
MGKVEKENSLYTEGSLSDRFDVWVRHTLKNLIMTEVRSAIREKRRRKEVLVGDMADDAFYDPFDLDAGDEVIVGNTVLCFGDPKIIEALKKLSPRKQQVIEGTVLLAIPVAMIAEQMNLNEQTIKNYKHDAISFLRKLLEENDE